MSLQVLSHFYNYIPCKALIHTKWRNNEIIIFLHYQYNDCRSISLQSRLELLNCPNHWPNTDRRSAVFKQKSLTSDSISTRSRISSWMCINARFVRRHCVIVFLSHVFNRRSAEKERSDPATLIGRHKHSRTNCSTSLNTRRVSGCADAIIAASDATFCTDFSWQRSCSIISCIRSLRSSIFEGEAGRSGSASSDLDEASISRRSRC